MQESLTLRTVESKTQGGIKGAQGDIVNCPHRVGGMGRHIQTVYLAKNAFTIHNVPLGFRLATHGGGLRFPLLACNRLTLFPKHAAYPTIQSR
jgi:hypothetical protein